MAIVHKPVAVKTYQIRSASPLMHITGAHMQNNNALAGCSKPRSKALIIADLCVNFFKFGCFTFGGGWGILAQIRKEYVEKKHWITDEELLDYTSVGRSLPGLMIGNVTIIVGYSIGGVLGGVLSLLAVSLPPFLIMLLVVRLYVYFSNNLFFSFAMRGVRAAVAAIILNALLGVAHSGLKDFYCYCIAASAFYLCFFTKISSALIIVFAAVAGLIIQEIKNRHDIF